MQYIICVYFIIYICPATAIAVANPHSVHEKSEREQGAIMRPNSLGVFRKSCWSLSPISIALKIHVGKISAISSHNFKRHVKIRLRTKVMVLWNRRYLALARVLLLTSSTVFPPWFEHFTVVRFWWNFRCVILSRFSIIYFCPKLIVATDFWLRCRRALYLP